MKVAVNEAAARLSDLVERAEAGEDVVLTREGRSAVRLVPVDMTEVPRQLQTVEDRRRALERISKEGAAKALPGPCAARSQDFLYDDDGLPT